MLKFGYSPHSLRPLLVCLSLVSGMVAALVILLSVVSPVQAQEVIDCQTKLTTEGEPTVPEAEKQEADCLPDMTTKAIRFDPDHTRTEDWLILNAAETPPEPLIPPFHAQDTKEPEVLVPGLQIDGYFPDDSTGNCYNQEDFGPECHDSQFVIRLPEKWNGKLVITGAPGVRHQFANDFIISDFVISKDYEEEGGYAFASTDKGNVGSGFYNDGEEPGDALAEWHRRVKQLTQAAKDTVENWYGERPDYTYMTGISNGGYLTRYALENHPNLYDGGVDWEGVLWRRNEPNLFTHLPPALRNYPECDVEGKRRACQRMFRAGYERGTKFIWDDNYREYWDITQRIFREEFDPQYDGDQKAGTPFCQEETSPPPPCDADYHYERRPERVKDAVERISLTGEIGKKMLTLHGTHDALLPIDLHTTKYRQLIENAGKANIHRKYVIEGGTHVDSYYDRTEDDGTKYREELRPILPCYKAAFEELEEWVELGAGHRHKDPPPNKFVPKPENSEIDAANHCSISREATYSQQ